MTKEIEGSLMNFLFAIENCGGITKKGAIITGSDIVELLNSRTLLEQYIKKQDSEVERLNAIVNAIKEPIEPRQTNP